MKVGITTQHLRNNYRGLLQNYALQQALKKLGHDTITLDQKETPVSHIRFIASILKTFILKKVCKGINRKYPFDKIDEKKIAYTRTYTQYFVDKYILHTPAMCKMTDFWGIEYVDDDFKDDKGCSLVIENTDKGRAVIGILDLYKKEYEQDYAFKYNPSAYMSVKRPNGRKRFWKAMMKGEALSSCLIVANPTLLERVINKVTQLMKR